MSNAKDSAGTTANEQHDKGSDEKTLEQKEMNRKLLLTLRNLNMPSSKTFSVIGIFHINVMH